MNISSFKPLRDSVFVEQLDNGSKITRGGIILLDDNMKDHGIHPRWCRVYAVGPDIEDLIVGDWILVKHGRWTNGMTVEQNGVETRIWRVEYPKATIMKSDVDPREHILMKDAHEGKTHTGIRALV